MVNFSVFSHSGICGHEGKGRFRLFAFQKMEEDSGGKLEAGGEGREICFYGRRIGGDVTSEEGKISFEKGKDPL